MKTLFVADPFSKLTPKSDTSLVFLRRALALGHDTYWTTEVGIEFVCGILIAKVLKVEGCEVDELPTGQLIESQEIKNFNWVFIRKDPPFNTTYVRLCWLLSLAKEKTRFINSPSLLLRYHEKLVPLEAVAQGFLKPKDLIATHVGSYDSAKDFVKGLGTDEIITKPFLGFAGHDITRMKASEFLGSKRPHEDLIVQPFIPEVEEGDHRVFFLNGKVLGSFARVPKEGHFVSNLAAGGTAKKVALTKKQIKVMNQLGAFLKAIKITFAGADLIGELVSEVNITSPTGLRAFEKLYGEDLSKTIFKEISKSK